MHRRIKPSYAASVRCCRPDLQKESTWHCSRLGAQVPQWCSPHWKRSSDMARLPSTMTQPFRRTLPHKTHLGRLPSEEPQLPKPKSSGHSTPLGQSEVLVPVLAMASAVVNPVASAFSTPKAVAPPGQPDISYAPDYGKYQARAARRLEAGNLPTSVPDGFPEQLKGDLVWEGDTLADTYDWTYVLSDSQLAEIDQAVKHFKCQSGALGAELSLMHGDTLLTSLISARASYLACSQGHFPTPSAALGTSAALP